MQLAGTLLQVAAASALGRQRVASLYCGSLPGEALAVPAALQPFETEEALLAALEAARAAVAAGSGPDLLPTEAAVKFNAWGGEGGWVGWGWVGRGEHLGQGPQGWGLELSARLLKQES